ncbi:MAG TPA: DUF6494 family protein [Nevskiaceae bacterium]|nr:DUF6494 family protein [Nevskiaceae bacterium]
MDEDVFNTTVRRFLKKVGVTSQQALEAAVRDALASGKLKGNETLSVNVRLECSALKAPMEIDGELKLA